MPFQDGRYLYVVLRGRLMAGYFGPFMRTFRLGIRGLYSDLRKRLIRDGSFVRAVRGFKDGDLIRDLLCRATQVFVIVHTILHHGACTATGLLRLPHASVKNRGSGHVLRVSNSTVVIDRAAFVRCLRRSIRRIQVNFLGLVRRSGKVQLTARLFDRLTTFLVTRVSQDNAGRAECNMFLRVLTRVSACRNVNETGRVFYRLLYRVHLARADETGRRGDSSKVIQIFRPCATARSYFNGFLCHDVLDCRLHL